MMQTKNHHAYGIIGTRESAETHLAELIPFARKGHPDCWELETESFGIDEARRVQETQMQRPVAGNLRVFLIFAEQITREAQNALLKTLEDPAPHARFILVVPSVSLLIPTLRSRLFLLFAGRGSDPLSELEQRVKDPLALREILSLKKYLRDPAASEKLILEHVRATIESA